MTPRDRQSVAQSARAYLRLLAPHFRLERVALVGLATLVLIVLAASLFAPVFVGRFVDVASTGDPQTMPTLIGLAVAFMVVGVLVEVAGAWKAMLGAAIAWRATNRLRRDLLAHTLQLGPTFHQRHSAGVMVERVDGDVGQLSNFFSELAVQLITNLLTVVGVVVIVSVLDWQVGISLVVFCVLAFWALQLVQGRGTTDWKLARESTSALYAHLQEVTGAQADLRGRGALDWARTAFRQRLWSMMGRTRRALMVSVGSSQLAGLLFNVGSIAVLIVSAIRYFGGDLTIGGVLQVSMYLALVNLPLRSIADQIDDLQSASASVARSQDLLDTPTPIVDGPGWDEHPTTTNLVFDNVSFSYPADEAEEDDPASSGSRSAVTGISLTVRAGTTMALIGRSGAGKSTILRLAGRSYDPSVGSVRLGDRDLRQATADQLARCIGVMEQAPRLFAASVRDNVCMFDPQISDAKVEEAIGAVRLDRWLARQPAGLDTQLDADGSGLSTGEAQLLCVARLFARDPELLLMDEPTSRLDPVSESLLMDSLARLMQDRTCVVIAHRLATLDRADSVALIEDGTVAEVGRVDELATDSTSRIRHLMNEQEVRR